MQVNVLQVTTETTPLLILKHGKNLQSKGLKRDTEDLRMNVAEYGVEQLIVFVYVYILCICLFLSLYTFVFLYLQGRR